MRRHVSCLSIICCLSLLSQQSFVSADSAISVPPDARATAAAAIGDAQSVIDKEQEALYRTEAEIAVQKADSEASVAALQATEAEKTLTEAFRKMEKTAQEDRVAAEQAKAAVDHAAALSEAAKQAEAAAEEATSAADEIDASLQAEGSALEQSRAQRAEAENTAAMARSVVVQPNVRITAAGCEQQSMFDETDELLTKEREIRELENMQKNGELAQQNYTPHLDVPDPAAEDSNAGSDSSADNEPTVDWSKADAAYTHANELSRIAVSAEEKFEQAERIAYEKTSAAEAAADKAAEAKQSVLDNQLAADDAKKYALQSKNYVMQTQTELKQLIYSQEHPQPLHAFSGGMNYYHWHDDFGNRGYQMTQPVDFSYWQKGFSYDLSTNYIISQNNTAGASGRVNTLSDTTLSLSKRNEKPKFIVDYNLNVNIPTGKSALSQSERYAMMNEDLVETSQFGKGWKFTPGVDVSWRIGKEDRWTVGTSYALNTSYDPTSDIANDTVSLGNEWKKFLRWQHAGQDWQFVGQLMNTATGLTRVANGSQYATGDQWEYRLTYNRHLSPKQDIMYYYWCENRNVDTIVPSDTSNARVHYFGTMWSKKLDDKHVFRVTFDVMKSNGSCYAGISNSYDVSRNPQYTAIDVAGRTKYTAGLGYDINMNEQSKLSIDLQAFTMKDGKSTSGQLPTTYKGLNLLLKYNRNI